MRTYIVFCAVVLSATAFSVSERPNIVWIMAEDIGPELSCYGHPAVHTPNIDRLSEQGVRYLNTFGTASSCTPNRNGMLLGMYQTRTDTQDQRRQTEVPNAMGLRTFPELLREAGYYTVLGFSKGGKTNKLDMNFKPTGKMFDGKDWNERKEGQPFFAHITFPMTHRSAKKGWSPIRARSKNPVKPEDVVLPPYFPDDPEGICRLDWAEYLDAIEYMDALVGQVLRKLENDGVAENTIVIFIGDNGQCHLRGKCWLYDAGLRVPMVIRGSGFKPGTVNADLISTIDITATVLDLAGVEIPANYDGQSFIAADYQPREHVFGAGDLVDVVVDRLRSVRTKQFKYIRNYDPEQGYLDCEYVQQNRPMRPVILKLKAEGKLTPAQELFFAETKPTEELYDIQADPFEINNLAENPTYAGELKKLSALLDDWIVDTQDYGLRTLEK